MGGGVSSVSQDINSKLSAESLLQLQEFQRKCEEEDMHPFDMFNFLTKKYEELLSKDFEHRNRLEIEPDAVDIIKKIEYAKDAAAIESGENIAVPEHLAEFYKEKERIDKELLDAELLANLKDIKKLELSNSRDPYVEDIVGKLFSIHNVYNNLTFEEYLKLNNAPEHELHNPDCVDCKICGIMFETHKEYEKHILHSDLHPKNVMEHKKRMFERFKEGERLAALAKSTVTVFFKAPPTEELHSHSAKIMGYHHTHHSTNNNNNTSSSTTAAEDEPHNGLTAEKAHHAKLLWKKAVARVISTRLRHHYEAIVDALNMLPGDVKLFHSDSKHFYNVKVNFVFNFYLHHRYQCIEVVPFVFFSPNDIAATTKNNHSTPSTPANSSHINSNNHTNTEEKDPFFQFHHGEGEESHLIKQCHRLYFNYYVLIGLVMGNHRITGVITEHEEDLTSHILHKGSPTHQLHTTNLSVVAVENLQDAEMVQLVNDNVCMFILSHLKTHNLTKKQKHLPILQQKIDETLYFDATALEESPLFEKAPDTLRPVEVNDIKVYHQWRDRFAQSTGFFPPTAPP